MVTYEQAIRHVVNRICDKYLDGGSVFLLLQEPNETEIISFIYKKSPTVVSSDILNKAKEILRTK